MIIALQMLSAACAAWAAYFWFRSALGSVPPPGVGWGGVISEDDPFMRAFNQSMRWNRWGACLAAFSALFAGMATALPLLISN